MRRPEPLPERLPLAEQAVVQRTKVRDYLLAPGHERGAHKARLWSSALGYRRADAELLRDDLRGAVVEGTVTDWRLTPGGAATWTVALALTGPNGRRVPVRSLWHVARIGAVPRLVSAWPDDDAAAARREG